MQCATPCALRPAGFSVGLYSGPNGYGPLSRPQTLSGTAASYTLNFGAVCPIQPATIAATIAPLVPAVSTQTATIARLSTSVASAMATLASSQLSRLQAELANLNTTTITHIATELSTLESSLTAQGNTAAGSLTAALTTTTSIATAAASGVGTLSTSVTQLASGVATLSTGTASAIGTMSAGISTAQSTGVVTNALLTTLRTAIIAAATDTPPTSTTLAQPSISALGGVLNVQSGTCNAADLCMASSFASDLKAALQSL